MFQPEERQAGQGLMTGQPWEQSGGPQPGDERLVVFFYTRYVDNPAKSRVTGLPEREPKPYIRIIIPGNNKEMNDRAVRMDHDGQMPPDPIRWPRQWETYLAKREQQKDGIPIEQCPLFSPDLVAMLSEARIFTVEVLAMLSDGQCVRLGALGTELRSTAQRYLKSSADVVVDLQHQVKVLGDQLAQAREAAEHAQSALRTAIEDRSAALEDAKGLRREVGELRAMVEGLTKPNDLHTGAEAAQHQQRAERVTGKR